MIYHSDKIKPFDIFFVNSDNDKHYYICIYAQEIDKNNKLSSDVYGIVITSNSKYRYLAYNDYNVPITINEKQAYINCDKLVRIKLDSNVVKKNIFVSNEIKKEIRYNLDKFITEIKKQTAEEVLLWFTLQKNQKNFQEVKF